MGFQDIFYRVGQFMGIVPEEPAPVEDFYQEEDDAEYEPEQVYRTPYGQQQQRGGTSTRRNQPSAPPPTRQAWEQQQQQQQQQAQQANPFGTKRATQPPRDNVIPMYRSGQAEEETTRKHIEVIVYVRMLEDCQHIIQAVLDAKSVFLNLEEVDDVMLQRVIDMLGGAAYALGATMQKISHRAYLVSPKTVDVVNSDMSGTGRKAEYAAYRR